MKRFIAACLFLFISLHTTLASTQADGLKFLQENARKPGVFVLRSGLQYKVLEKGNGKESPTSNSECKVHYHGTHVNGEVFDSSVDRGTPIELSPNAVIKGWSEIMQRMVEGDKFEVYLPSELAYGEAGSPPVIDKNEALVFTVEMIKINGDKIPAFLCTWSNRDDCTDKEMQYITKIEQRISQEQNIEKEISRLHNLSDKNLVGSLEDWRKRRLVILEYFDGKVEESEKEL